MISVETFYEELDLRYVDGLKTLERVNIDSGTYCEQNGSGIFQDS